MKLGYVVKSVSTAIAMKRNEGKRRIKDDTEFFSEQLVVVERADL